MSNTQRAPLPAQTDDNLTVSGTTGGDFQVCPPGPVAGICVDVVYLGWSTKTFPGQEPKDVEEIALVFLVDKYMEDGRPFWVRRRFTKSLHVKSNLRKFLNDWRGTPLTDEQAENLNLNVLVGKPALLQITNTTRNNNTYADIGTVMKLVPGMTLPSLYTDTGTPHYIRVKDRPATPPAGTGAPVRVNTAAASAPVHRTVASSPPPPTDEWDDFPGALDDDDELPF